MNDAAKLAKVRGMVALLAEHAEQGRVPPTTSSTTGVAGRCCDILAVIDYGVEPSPPQLRRVGEPLDWRGWALAYLGQERAALPPEEISAIEKFLGVDRC